MNRRAAAELNRARVVRDAVVRANARQRLEAEHQQALAGLGVQDIGRCLDMMADRDRAIGRRGPNVPRHEGMLCGLVIWANVDPEVVSGTSAAAICFGLNRVVLVADDQVTDPGQGRVKTS